VTGLGGDNVIITRMKGGKEERISVDLDAAFLFNDLDKNLEMLPGDTVYVPRYPLFYIYGQVGRPGQFRLERNMTVMQAVALGGGVTLRGTEKGIQIRRRDVGGKVETLNAGLQDRVMQDDVIYVRESVF
jgi:polysaccharide export outer membrane protein